MQLRARLSLALLSTALAAVLLAAGLGTVLSARFLEGQARVVLRQQAQIGSDLLQLGTRVEQRLRRTDDALAEQIEPGQLIGRTLTRLGVTVLTGDPDLRTGPLSSLLSLRDLQQLRDGQEVQGTGEVDGQRVAYHGVPGRPVAVAYRSLAGVQEGARAVGQRLLGSGFAAVVVAGLLGLLLGDRLARPVRRLEDTVQAVASGDLDRRVDLMVTRRLDELGDLGRGIDRMTTALADSRGQQRSFFRSVAHELRTPLTNIRGYAEGLADGNFADRPGHAATVILDESIRLQALVEDVMVLARLDAGDLTVDPVPTDLHQILVGAADAAATVASTAGISVEVAGPPVMVQTDGLRVRQIVDNLVANALRVVPDGGSIALSTSVNPVGGARLTIADSGPGLTPDEVAVAFERYELWRRHRGVREVGTGLGLAIVAELTRRLGGSVQVAGHGPLGGAMFTVELPGSPSRALGAPT